MQRSIPYFDLKKQYQSIKPEIDEAVHRVLDSGSYVSGKEVEAFESEFAEYHNRKYCVAVNSGTSALHLALMPHTGERKGYVITVPNTFVATAEAIEYCNENVRFVDANYATGVMDANQLDECLDSLSGITRIISSITPTQITAIIPVDLWGNPCNMEAILAIAKQYNIPVINDACQAHGARYKDGSRVGSKGQASCFSFYPSKILGCYGEGGAIVTNDKDEYCIMKSYRDHGQDTKNYHGFIGYNYRMSELQASILRVKLKHIEQWVVKRIHKAMLYSKLLNLPVITGSSYYVYTIRVKNRDWVVNRLKEQGIGTAIHYPTPIHLQPAYVHLGYKRGDFPVAEQLCEETLSLPLYPELPDEDIKYVCDVLKEVI